MDPETEIGTARIIRPPPLIVDGSALCHSLHPRSTSVGGCRSLVRCLIAGEITMASLPCLFGGLHTLQAVYRFPFAFFSVVLILLFERYLQEDLWYFFPVLVTYTTVSPSADVRATESVVPIADC